MLKMKYNYDESYFHTDMFYDIETGKNQEDSIDNNETKKEKLKRLKMALLGLLVVTGIKVGVDTYKIHEGKEKIMDEFNNYFDCHVNNPSYGIENVSIDSEVYSIDAGIKNIIDGCRLNGMDDDEISVILLDYFPSSYVNDYLNTNILTLRKACIKKYNEDR